jgi:hypothetical protein
MMLPEIARAQPGPGPGPAPAPPAPYPGQPNPGQPYQGQPNPAQPYQGQPNPAQPYPGQPYPGQPYPGQPYPGQPYPGQPYPGQYPPPYGGPPPLTPDEQRLLAEGEISPGEIVGGVVGTWVLGFGLGHAIQGRWSDRGWVFTLGESASLILLFVGLAQSSGESGDSGDVSIATGAIGWGVFRIWSIFDAAIGPSSHNSKVRDVKRRIGLPVDARRIIPYVAPGRERGGVAGLTFRF